MDAVTVRLLYEANRKADNTETTSSMWLNQCGYLDTHKFEIRDNDYVIIRCSERTDSGFIQEVKFGKLFTSTMYMSSSLGISGTIPFICVKK